MVSKTLPRRTVLQGLGGLAVAGAARAETAPGATGEFGFVAIGDWGRKGGMRQGDVAVAMGKAAAEVESRFVLSAGDNFYPAGVESATDEHWRKSFQDVYTAPALQTPWIAALGNHDYRGHPGAQVAYARTNRRWRMPSRYYALGGAEFGVPQLEVFVLDTTPIVGGDAEALMRLTRGRVTLPDPEPQVAWLAAALAGSTAEWKLVVGHHPIRSGGRHGDSAILQARIEPLLAAHGVQAYICGHDHDLQHIRAGGTDHICTGSGSSCGDAFDVEGGLFRQSVEGFAMFRLDGETLRLDFRDFTGRTLHQSAIPKGPVA